MEVYLFIGDSKIRALTQDNAGNNLPGNGKWTFIKSIDLDSGESTFIDTLAAKEGIEKNGYYAYKIQVAFEEKIIKPRN